MIPPTTNGATHSHQDVEEVHFIDYEYATPSPAAFDIANHFAEWGGYDCDYNMMPTRSIRREFLTEYVKSFVKYGGKGADSDQQKVVDKLFQDVDRFRGIPGFYWCVLPTPFCHILISANKSLIQGCLVSYPSNNLTNRL
jgi:ethanolamine kinase